MGSADETGLRAANSLHIKRLGRRWDSAFAYTGNALSANFERDSAGLSHRRREPVLADEDAGGLDCAIAPTRPARDDMGARFEVAPRSRRKADNRRLGVDHDRLLAAMVSDGQLRPLDAIDARLDRSIGHGAAGREIERAEALARPAHRFRKNMHLDRLEFVALARQRGDSDEGAGLHLGERGRRDERDAGLIVEAHCFRLALARADGEAFAIRRNALDGCAQGGRRAALGESRRGGDEQRCGEREPFHGFPLRVDEAGADYPIPPGAPARDPSLASMSASAIAQALETLRLLTGPGRSSLATTSQFSRVRRLKPRSSAPSTSAIGRLASTSGSAAAPSESRPTRTYPMSPSSLRARARLGTNAIGTCSSPPEADFASAPESSGEWRSVVMSPSAAKAAAVLKIAPKLCGSVT